MFLTRLPLASLHKQLDHLATKFPERRSFQEFRAPMWMVQAEAEALAYADYVVTPHAMLAALFSSKVCQLKWKLPAIHSNHAGTCIAFPGPALARKGAYELRDSLRALKAPLILLNTERAESKQFWKDVDVAPISQDWLEKTAVVVQPAFIENNPRQVLRALAAGIPVIATKECGIEAHPSLTLVGAGDSEELTSALQGIFLKANRALAHSEPTR